jgi:hypothetical protein
MNKLEMKKDKKKIKGIVVKGYLRPDGTYYLSIPKRIREALDLKGGELFFIKVKPEERKMSAAIIDIPDEEIE